MRRGRSSPDAGSGRAEPTPYSRGGGGGGVDSTRVLSVLGAVSLAILATLAVAFLLGTVRQELRGRQLRRDGIPVTVSVTGCVALGSGTGVTVYGYTCRGSYVLAGHRYTGIIGGTAALRHPGDIVRALALAGHPSSFATVRSVDRAQRGWRALLPSSLLLGALSLLSVGYFRRLHRLRAQGH